MTVSGGGGVETIDDSSHDSTRLDLIGSIIASCDRIVNQQRDEQELTTEEKSQFLSTLLEEKPHIFLERFHKFIKPEFCMYLANIDHHPDHSASISHFISLIQTSTQTNEKEIRNRRFNAMNRLMKTSNYFSETEMRSRDPEVWGAMIGRHLTPEEVTQVINQPSTSGSRKSRVDVIMDTLDQQMFPTPSTLEARESSQTDVEFDSDDDSGGEEMETSIAAMGSSSKPSGAAFGAMESSSQSPHTQFGAMEGPSKQPETSSKPQPTPSNAPETSSISSQTSSKPPEPSKSTPDLPVTTDKELGRGEFLLHMQRRFLAGEDDFDYASVDNDAGLDAEAERDCEERYFDSD